MRTRWEKKRSLSLILGISGHSNLISWYPIIDVSEMWDISHHSMTFTEAICFDQTCFTLSLLIKNLWWYGGVGWACGTPGGNVAFYVWHSSGSPVYRWRSWELVWWRYHHSALWLTHSTPKVHQAERTEDHGAVVGRLSSLYNCRWRCPDVMLTLQFQLSWCGDGLAETEQQTTHFQSLRWPCVGVVVSQ